ncbi:MAG TPA: SCO family protein [Nocardioidaceae bacterium]|nr:SCO family protein [Nocardioidaceae bacterium]
MTTVRRAVPSARPVRTVLVTALCLLLGLVTAACGASSAAPAAPGNDVGTRLDGTVPQRILSLPLHDSTGKVRHLSDFAGKVVVISDGMTLCQESCPLDTTSIVETARRVKAAGASGKVVFLSITVDPARDSVPQMAAYRKLFAPAPANWLALTGSAHDVGELWDYLGVYRKKVPGEPPYPKNWRTGAPVTYDVEHTDAVFFLDGRQHERFVLTGLPHLASAKDVPSELYSFMTAGGRRNVHHPKSTAWTIPQALQVIGWLTGTDVS